MDCRRISLHAERDGVTAFSNRLHDELVRLGCQVVAWNGKPDLHPLVIVIHQVDERLAELVDFASNHGECLVWAIADQEGLLLTDINRLLLAGAADAICTSDAKTAAAFVGAKCERDQRLEIAMESAATGRFIGNCPIWRSALREIVETAIFSAGPVLIVGETGTGKEQAAHLIHHFDSRTAKQNLVVVDCAAVATNLSMSDFYGHVRGAFTGCTSNRLGAFALADGGTLFLDEIGELPLHMQAELLRVLQEGTFKPVGSNCWEKTSFRLISATHRDLSEEIERRAFRQDLYFRIAGNVIEMPALKDRAADILIIAHHLLREVFGPQPPEITPELSIYLRQRRYAGNVRELKHLIEGIASRYAGAGPLTFGLISKAERFQASANGSSWCEGGFKYGIARAVETGIPLKEIGRVAENLAIHYAIELAGGNLPRAAKHLAVSDRAVQIRVASWKSDPRERSGSLERDPALQG